MSAIELNGVSSSTVAGLLIQSLPPISKPRIRTLVEEIDGRDGDTVTVLGYAAYDKTVKIGLKGSFDINDVIAFFASSGTVIFSNEDDKFYRYAIYDLIDFERLIRFREGNVKFHVQPFKYAVSEMTPSVITITSQTEIDIDNDGNEESKPIIGITGAGSVVLSLNGNQALTLALDPDGETIMIDTESLEATTGGLLANRKVTGGYENLWCAIGTNVLSWTGTVTEISVQYSSRWI